MEGFFLNLVILILIIYLINKAFFSNESNDLPSERVTVDMCRKCGGYGAWKTETVKVVCNRCQGKGSHLYL